MRRLAQPPVEAGRRDLERVALAQLLERLADRRAQVEVDPARPVDEQRQDRRLAADLEVDELDVGEPLGECGFDDGFQFLSLLPHTDP